MKSVVWMAWGRPDGPAEVDNPAERLASPQGTRGSSGAHAPFGPLESGRQCRARVLARTHHGITRRHLVVALGLLWILDGALQLQPYMYSRDFVASVLQDQTMGAPNPATDLIRVLVLFTYSTPTRQIWFNTAAVLVQFAIGAGLLWRCSERVALAGSFLWGFVPWLTGEGMGGMLFPQSTMFLTGAPGAALVYSLLSLVLWPRRADDRKEGQSVAEAGLLGGRGARIVWAAIWIGTGLLELESANWAPNAIAAQLRYSAGGQPGWLAAIDRLAAHLSAGRGTAIAMTLLLVQVLVGWWVLRSSTRRLSLFVGIAVSLCYWVVGQNLGQIFTGTGTDLNLGPLMVLFALALWPRRGGEPDRSVPAEHGATLRDEWATNAHTTDGESKSVPTPRRSSARPSKPTSMPSRKAAVVIASLNDTPAKPCPTPCGTRVRALALWLCRKTFVRSVPATHLVDPREERVPDAIVDAPAVLAHWGGRTSRVQVALYGQRFIQGGRE